MIIPESSKQNVPALDNNTVGYLRIIVRGSNDVASAVAHRLFSAGYSVVIHEVSKPTDTRRKMSFTDAIFEGETSLEGVSARKIVGVPAVQTALVNHIFIPIHVGTFHRLVKKLSPQVIVDARMRKHKKPMSQIHLAPLTLGLGPNFIAGVNVRIAIETARGEDLGRVITTGRTTPLKGEPISIEGHARDRYLYAPYAGDFKTTFQIGEMVTEDQVIASINDMPLTAPISGVIRGLTHDSVPVELRTKVIEIDPRCKKAQIDGIGERPMRIANGVLTAIQQWKTKVGTVVPSQAK